ncbi:unnamed protein product [Malus baccata var. baccata]
MAVDNRTIKELSASGLDNALPLCIQYPRAAQNKTDEFELKSSLLHHIPKFYGLSMEDPNKHLKEFEVVCSSMIPVNVNGSILKMKAFPFSLLEKAKDWLYELAPGTVTSWESMKWAFLEKFFLTTRVILLRKRISGIQQNQAIILRSRKEVGSNPNPSKSNQNEDEKMQFKEKEQGLPSARIEQSLPQPPTHPNLTTKGKLGSNSMTSNSIPPNAPFPRRFMQSKKDESDKDILDTFRKVQVNIPLLDAIKQVPKYAKFLKELCTTRKRASNKEVVRVSENVSAVLQRKLPPKCKDPGSFTIPCVIGNTRFKFAMLDLGVLEDVLVQMNHLVFPVDFYVLEMGDSNHSPQLPILLGQPFMKTTRTKINVFKGTLTMEFDGEVIDFNISDAMRYPHDGYSCFSIDLIDSWAQEFLDDLSEDALEKTLMQSIGLKNEGLALRHAHGNNKEHLAVPIQEEFVEMVAALESNPRHIEQETMPVIISFSLTAQEEDKLVRVLREYKTAIGWTLTDIKGISATTCLHRILLEEGAKPSREAQCRLNPPMMDVVKKEIIKLLDCGMIYLISNSHWVSPVQVFPKKSGVTVVKNEDNEFVPT